MKNYDDHNIFYDLIKSENSRAMKLLGVLANSALMTMLLAAFVTNQSSDERIITIAKNVMALAALFVMVAIVPIGLRYISRNQGKPIVSIVLKVVFFMFVIPLLLTIALVTIGWFFNWEGINPK